MAFSTLNLAEVQQKLTSKWVTELHSGLVPPPLKVRSTPTDIRGNLAAITQQILMLEKKKKSFFKPKEMPQSVTVRQG